MKADAPAPGPPPSLDLAAHALFLDIDGTLVGHESHPAAVQAPAALHGLLGRLACATGGALALVSGRAIDDIDGLFGSGRWPCAGQHGAERRDASGLRHRHAGPLPDGVLDRLRSLARDHPALVLEEKGSSLALHYRRAPELAGLVEREMAVARESIGVSIELLRGKFVVEIKPRGRDKGTAIAAFLEEAPFRGRIPVFLGDDVTDEPGFDLVNARRGLSVKVGEGPTAARSRLAGAPEVLDWLARLGQEGAT